MRRGLREGRNRAGMRDFDAARGPSAVSILTLASPVSIRYRCPKRRCSLHRLHPQASCQATSHRHARKCFMLDIIQLAWFSAAAFVLAVTPGPGLFYVVARTLSGGRAEGV